MINYKKAFAVAYPNGMGAVSPKGKFKDFVRKDMNFLEIIILFRTKIHFLMCFLTKKAQNGDFFCHYKIIFVYVA